MCYSEIQKKRKQESKSPGKAGSVRNFLCSWFPAPTECFGLNSIPLSIHQGERSGAQTAPSVSICEICGRPAHVLRKQTERAHSSERTQRVRIADFIAR